MIQIVLNIKIYQIIVGGTKLLTLPLVYIWLLLGGSPLVGILANIIIEVACLYPRLYFNFKYNGLSWHSYVFKSILPCWAIFIIAFLPSYLIRLYVSSNIFVTIITSLVITTLVIGLLGLKKNERHLVIAKAISIINKNSK